MSDIVNELIAGDSLDYTVAVDGYSAVDGWILKDSLRGPSSIDLTASASGSAFHIQADSTTTATWLPGNYNWVRTVSKSGQRYTVASGTLVIKADLTQAPAGYDGRSLAAKALSDAETALATFRATRGRTKKYTIGSRSMEFESVGEILAEINYWKLRVANESTAESIASGLGNPRRLGVRFR